MKLTVAPLTPDRWLDLEAISNAKGCSVARGCWCMAYRRSGSREPLAPGMTRARANRAGLKALVDAGHPPGLIGSSNACRSSLQNWCSCRWTPLSRQGRPVSPRVRKRPARCLSRRRSDRVRYNVYDDTAAPECPVLAIADLAYAWKIDAQPRAQPDPRAYSFLLARSGGRGPVSLPPLGLFPCPILTFQIFPRQNWTS